MIGPVQLTRAQQRKLKKFEGGVGRITRADRLFFERRPDRQYRVRLAGHAEVEQQLILGDSRPPPGFRFYVTVHNVVPGAARLRQFLVAPEGLETDLPEEVARGIYETAATPKTREIEAEVRRKVEDRA